MTRRMADVLREWDGMSISVKFESAVRHAADALDAIEGICAAAARNPHRCTPLANLDEIHRIVKGKP